VADKTRINQITLNLLSNAVKYTPAGGTVSYISDSEDLPDAKIRFGFEVRDTGIGMSEEFQRQMFKPFTQEYDNPQRPKGTTGTGLGLYIVKRMVDLMGGQLEVSSTPGQGTVVKCHLVCPDAARDPRYQTRLQPKQQQAAPAQLAGRVLLAEDNPVNTEIAKRILTSFGLTVDHAPDGSRAVEMFAAAAPGFLPGHPDGYPDAQAERL
jgi:CheY-like chemotaxis protein